jgi:RHS repeat-associated protein
MEFAFQDSQQPARLRRLFRGKHQILFHYDATHRLERIVDSTGRNIIVVEEADGRLTSLTLEGAEGQPNMLIVACHYDERGNLVATKNASGHGYAFTYDKANRMLTRRGRMGFKFRFDYDAFGRCIKATGDDDLYGVTLTYTVARRVTKVRRADNGEWTYFFDAAGGLAKIRDPLGGIQKFVRDETGRVVMEVDPNGNATRLAYDSAGAPVARISALGHVSSVPENPNAPDPNAHRVAGSALEYELGRLIETAKITVPTTEDLRSLRIPFEVRAFVTTQPGKIATGQRKNFEAKLLGPNWWPEPKQGRIFNDFGKLVEQHDEFGRRRLWTYNASGNVAGYTDFDGGKWSYDNGSWHLLRQVVNPLGAEVRFSYTTNGKVASCVDPGGTLSEYRYDHKDHLVEVKRHGVVRDSYIRDTAGNLVAKHDSNGRELLRFEISSGNLPIKRTLSSGDEHTFQYDKFGRYLAVATRKDSVEFGYDIFGNRCAEKRNGQGVQHRFQYWRMPVQSVFFDRIAVRYEWETDGVLAIIDPGDKKQCLCFLPHGLVERQFSNGSHELVQYDSQGRCLLKYAERAAGQTWRRRYQWSGEGELLSIQDNLYGQTRYGFDAAHRLRRRVLGGAEDYELDPADNLICQPGLRDVIIREGNRLSSANGFSVHYNDRNHIATRQTPEGTVRYGYDSRDQLVRVETPRGLWEAEYDALGRRTRKTWSGETTEYYWNTDQLIAEFRSDGRLRLYVYANPLALTPLLFFDYESVDAPPESCQRYFIFTDQLGTPRAVENESGVEVWSAQIEPYGNARVASGATIESNLRFPGHYFDPELALHYNRFRYYDPILGRYLQSDRSGISGGYNLYAYRSNPLLTVDVRGLGGDEGKGTPPKKPPAEDGQDEETGGTGGGGGGDDELPSKEEALAQAKTDAGIPLDQEPDDVRIVPLTDKFGKQILDENYQPIFTEEQDYLMPDGSIVTIQDHQTGHQFGEEGGVGDQPPHFNVRPGDDTRTGVVPGTQSHYPYDPTKGE